MSTKIEQAKVPLWQFGEAFKDESSKPSEHCADPSRWTMMDEATPEVEVLKTLHSLVILCKPKMVLSVGDRTGYASLYMAQALRENGIGKVTITGLEEDEEHKAMEICLASGLDRYAQFGDTEKIVAGVEFDFVYVGGRRDLAVWAMSLTASKTPVVVHGPNLPQLLDAKVQILNLPTPRGLVLLQRP